MTRATRFRGFASVLAMSGLLVVVAGAARGATFTPATVADLVANVATANANGASDVVELGGLTFTLTVANNAVDGSNGLPDVTEAGTTLTIRNGTIAAGGAFRILHVAAGATLVLENVTLSGGSAGLFPGGAVYNAGTLSATSCTFSGNASDEPGGAIYNTGDVAAIRNCTFSGNSAYVGGGLHNDGTVASLTNSTFAQNAAGYQGGGISNGQGGTITSLASCIVATNTGGDGPPEFADGGVTASAADNLIGTNDGHGVANGVNGNQVGTGASPLDPLLGPLGNNGGPTATHALLAGSPAIDAGGNPAALAFDQRGTPFARTSGAGTDVGAFELQVEADLSVTKTDGVTTVNAGGTTTYTIVVANAGPSAVTGAAFADPFPASLTCTTSSVAAGGATGNTPAGAGSVSDALSLPPGSSVTYTASCTLSPAAFGTVSNTATVSAPAGVTDPNAGNDSATDTDTIATGAALSATKTVAGTFAASGTVTYTIVLTNGGIGPQADAPGDELVDVLPATLALVGATASSGTALADVPARTVRWNGAIAPGGSVTVTVTATVLVSAVGTTVSNQGSLSFDGNGDGANDATALTDDPALPGAQDPTAFAVALASAVVPVLGPFGTALLALLVAAAGLAARPR